MKSLKSPGKKILRSFIIVFLLCILAVELVSGSYVLLKKKNELDKTCSLSVSKQNELERLNRMDPANWGLIEYIDPAPKKELENFIKEKLLWEVTR